MRLKSILILLVVLLALGGYFYYSSRPQPVPQPAPQVFVWLFEMEELQRVEMQLPQENLNQAFIKEADRSWSFDDAQRAKVDMKRWGGGIPLLLSGPAAARVIATNATAEKLAEFGLTQPQMKIILTLESGKIMDIIVGHSTPDGTNYYVQAPGSNDVALVDYTWYGVLERLIKDPPFISPATK